MRATFRTGAKCAIYPTKSVLRSENDPIALCFAPAKPETSPMKSMKPDSRIISRRTLSCGALVFLLAGSASAQTTLLTDSFDTVVLRDAFNDRLAADQTGTLAPLAYTIVGQDWEGFIQSGNGGNMLLAGYDPNSPLSGNMNQRVSLSRNFAIDANASNAPLEIEFNLIVSNSSALDNWSTVAVGSSQNAFVNAATNKFSSLFRDNGETEQWAAGVVAGNTLTFTDGDLITLVLSNANETGSAFADDGATDVAKLYLNGQLEATFPNLNLTEDDGFVSFQAIGAQGRYGNLVISALAASNPDYDTWAGSFTPPIGLPAADDDNDGLSNQEEYAFGLLPNSGSSVNPITVALDKSTGTFSYTRRDSSLAPLNYSIWYSTDLVTWAEDTNATEGTPSLSSGVETVPVTLSNLPGNPLPAKLFIQVRAN